MCGAERLSRATPLHEFTTRPSGAKRNERSPQRRALRTRLVVLGTEGVALRTQSVALRAKAFERRATSQGRRAPGEDLRTKHALGAWREELSATYVGLSAWREGLRASREGQSAQGLVPRATRVAPGVQSKPLRTPGQVLSAKCAGQKIGGSHLAIFDFETRRAASIESRGAGVRSSPGVRACVKRRGGFSQSVPPPPAVVAPARGPGRRVSDRCELVSWFCWFFSPYRTYVSRISRMKIHDWKKTRETRKPAVAAAHDPEAAR